MKKMKLFQKTYLFTVGLMAIIIIISHTLLYMLLPSFYTNKKQQDLDNISYQLTEQLQNNNSNKSDEIAKKFADMHNINILLSVNGKNKVYEGIIEEAGKDHLIIRDNTNNLWYLIRILYLNYVEFMEPIIYSHAYSEKTY